MSDEPIHPSQFTEETDPAPDTVVWGITDPDGEPGDVRIPISALGGGGGGAAPAAAPHGVRIRDYGSLSGTKATMVARIPQLGAMDFTVQVKGRWYDGESNTPGLISLTSDPSSANPAASVHVLRWSDQLQLYREGASGRRIHQYALGTPGREDFDLVLVRDAADADVYALYLDGQRLVEFDAWDEGTPPDLHSALDATYLALVAEDVYWDTSNRRLDALYEASYAYGVGLGEAEVAQLVEQGWQAFPEYVHTRGAGGRNTMPVEQVLSYGADDAWANLPPSSLGFSIQVASGARTGGEGDYYLRSHNGDSSSQRTLPGGTIIDDHGRTYIARAWLWAKELSGQWGWMSGVSSFHAGVDIDQVISVAETWEQVTLPPHLISGGSRFLAYRATGAEAISGQEVRIDDVEIIPVGLAGHWVFDRGPGRQARDLTLGGEPMVFNDPSLEWHSREQGGTRTEIYRFAHDEISATAATTVLLLLPPRCGVIEVELDREEEFDASVTADIGVSGTADRFVDAAALDASGPLAVESLDKATQDQREHTAIYIKKSGATTQGKLAVRLTYRVRG